MALALNFGWSDGDMRAMPWSRLERYYKELVRIRTRDAASANRQSG